MFDGCNGDTKTGYGLLMGPFHWYRYASLYVAVNLFTLAPFLPNLYRQYPLLNDRNASLETSAGCRKQFPPDIYIVINVCITYSSVINQWCKWPDYFALSFCVYIIVKGIRLCSINNPRLTAPFSQCRWMQKTTEAQSWDSKWHLITR